MKFLYCANCGTRLQVMRKALPKYGVIVDIVEFHICPDTPVEFDLKPIDLPTFKEVEGKNKFVQKLNGLNPKPSFAVDSNDLRDRRFESSEPKSDTKTTAPSNVLDILKSIENGE